MGFPKGVKNRILVAAARHCCVCHRYKGVGVEAHHIIQEADGGPNTYENAIALCFDCHAAAGHYNSRHPRGTKFSPEELRLARKTWLEMVEKNQIHPSAGNSDVLCRYYVCKNFDFLRNITSLKLSDFPVTQPILCKNNVFYALVDMVGRHPKSYRHATLWGRKFESEEAYLKIYPHPEDEPDHERYPYFSRTRPPTKADLISLNDQDGLVSAMLEHGLDAEGSVAVAGCYEAACEGIEFQEEYLLRAIWGVFLAVENRSDDPITLSYLQAEVSTQAGFDVFSKSDGEVDQLQLPQAPLLPGMTVIIPVSVLIPPLHPIKAEIASTELPDGKGDYYRAISHCLMKPGYVEECLTYGGFVQPSSLIYRKETDELRQNIHPFDLTNFYEMDMHWGCGSCPHLFFRYQDNQKLKYERELLRSCEGRLGDDTFVVPAGVFEIVLAELEDEVTELVAVRINSEEVASNVRLDQGDDLRFSVRPGDVIELRGRYQPSCPVDRNLPTGRIRNELIYNYLARIATA
ncbi:MAG: HNH endonuclease signature motif containing protein [Alcanivorax sp.]